MSNVSGKITFAEAKRYLSSLTKEANSTGYPFVITKNQKPWFEDFPLAFSSEKHDGISIIPVTREIQIPDLDELFEGYDRKVYISEDEFVATAGSEVF